MDRKNMILGKYTFTPYRVWMHIEPKDPANDDWSERRVWITEQYIVNLTFDQLYNHVKEVCGEAFAKETVTLETCVDRWVTNHMSTIWN